MRIFILGEELQLFEYNNGSTFKISQLIVGLIQRFVLGRKVTLRTLWTYEHHLRLLFMEWHSGVVQTFLHIRIFLYSILQMFWSPTSVDTNLYLPSHVGQRFQLCLPIKIRTFLQLSFSDCKYESLCIMFLVLLQPNTYIYYHCSRVYVLFSLRPLLTQLHSRQWIKDSKQQKKGFGNAMQLYVLRKCATRSGRLMGRYDTLDDIED